MLRKLFIIKYSCPLESPRSSSHAFWKSCTHHNRSQDYIDRFVLPAFLKQQGRNPVAMSQLANGFRRHVSDLITFITLQTFRSPVIFHSLGDPQIRYGQPALEALEESCPMASPMGSFYGICFAWIELHTFRYICQMIHGLFVCV